MTQIILDYLEGYFCLSTHHQIISLVSLVTVGPLATPFLGGVAQQRVWLSLLQVLLGICLHKAPG